MNPPVLDLQWQDWLTLFLNYMMLSLISIGGVITTVPEMYRFLVDQKHWLMDAQFNGSIALAQAAPGPNVLFVALLGWNLGLNAGGYGWAILGMLTTLIGVLLPSTTLTYLAARWGHRNRERPVVCAFKQGMGPIVIALLIATGWLLAGAHRQMHSAPIVFGAKTRMHIFYGIYMFHNPLPPISVH